jgi:hypothetical protein
MFRLLATKLRSQCRARSVPSGWDLEIDTSAPLDSISNILVAEVLVAYAEKYLPGNMLVSIDVWSGVRPTLSSQNSNEDLFMSGNFSHE